MNNFNDVSYKEIPTDEECMINAVKIAELIGEPASKVRKWAEYHEDNLYIKKVNGKFVYTQKSVEQFKLIQKLQQEKHMTHEQIKQYMKKHGLEYGKYSTGLINPNDPFGYDVLSTVLAQKTEIKLQEFMHTFMQHLEQQNIKFANDILFNVEETVQERIAESMKDVNSELQDIKKEIAVTKDMNEKLDFLKASMEQRKETNKESNKKTFWQRIFFR